MGTKVDMIAGFRDKDLIILENEMREASDRLIVMTDDGSNGNKGFVTAALQKNIDEGADYDLVIAIGPVSYTHLPEGLYRAPARYQVEGSGAFYRPDPGGASARP